MKLNSVSCMQFAGLRDVQVKFDSGINVLYGKNESGKSTLVNLISRTLFQNARIDGRTDKEFRELYFPSAVKGSAAKGDFIDGKLSFETDKGTYILSKEWGTDGRCLLSTPDGVIRDPKTIDSLLREALVYGEGVYTQLLFSSQRGSDHALQALLDASSKENARQDIADAVTMAMAESSGVSVEAIEQAINTKIDELLGKHWDLALDRPVRKSTRWSAGLGEILKAYYELEDAKIVLDKIVELEREADRTAMTCAQAQEQAYLAEQALDAFRGFASALAVRNERKDKIRRLEDELRRYQEVLSGWPALLSALEKGMLLEKEYTLRKCVNRLEAVRELCAQKQRLSELLEKTSCPSQEQISAVRTAQKHAQTLQNALCGMNLSAVFRMFGDHTLEVRSLRTGELLDIHEEQTAITEAVMISVPDVMEIRLAPADVDVEDITARLDNQKHLIRDVFETFGVEDVDALEAIARRVDDARRSLETVDTKLAALLGDDSLETLEKTVSDAAMAPRSEEHILADIAAFCGGDVSRFLTVTETKIKGYEAEYSSLEMLRQKTLDVSEEFSQVKALLENTQAIPEEYLSVTSPEAHLKSLETALREKQRAREEALSAKSVAARCLQDYQEQLQEEPQERYDSALSRLQEKKQLLAHWMHIREVFCAQKETLTGNPMEELAARFAHNLQILSDSSITTEFPESDRLNMTLYTRDREIDFTKLSEGTKETVSLAFRLAMLDHVFPEGGVIVLDDPFANMDAERTKRSCTLLQDCATRHQVIFLTCKEEYSTILEGTCIRL